MCICSRHVDVYILSAATKTHMMSMILKEIMCIIVHVSRRFDDLCFRAYPIFTLTIIVLFLKFSSTFLYKNCISGDYYISREKKKNRMPPIYPIFPCCATRKQLSPPLVSCKVTVLRGVPSVYEIESTYLHSYSPSELWTLHLGTI